MDSCEVARCRAGADLTYLGHGVCERHWNMYTADDMRPDQLREVLGIEAAPIAATEEAMDDGTKKAKAEADAKAEAAGKASKKAKAAPKETKPAKEPKAKREPIADACVFAFRLSVQDRSRIHEAAGPAGATRFVRSAALAAANGDREAFEALAAQARSNLK